MRPIHKWASPCTTLAPPSPRVPCARSPVGTFPCMSLVPPSIRRPPSLRASPRFVSPPFRLVTGSVGVQPAAESGHVERHRHVRHVLCAAARALRPIPSRPFPCKTVAPQTVAPRPAHLLTRPALRLIALPSDSAVGVGVQPATELRHVQGHNHVCHVLGALRPCPDPQPLVGSSSCVLPYVQNQTCIGCSSCAPHMTWPPIL